MEQWGGLCYKLTETKRTVEKKLISEMSERTRGWWSSTEVAPHRTWRGQPPRRLPACGIPGTLESWKCQARQQPSGWHVGLDTGGQTEIQSSQYVLSPKTRTPTGLSPKQEQMDRVLPRNHIHWEEPRQLGAGSPQQGSVCPGAKGGFLLPLSAHIPSNFKSPHE